MTRTSRRDLPNRACEGAGYVQLYPTQHTAWDHVHWWTVQGTGGASVCLHVARSTHHPLPLSTSVRSLVLLKYMRILICSVEGESGPIITGPRVREYKPFFFFFELLRGVGAFCVGFEFRCCAAEMQRPPPPKNQCCSLRITSVLQSLRFIR